MDKEKELEFYKTQLERTREDLLRASTFSDHQRYSVIMGVHTSLMNLVSQLEQIIKSEKEEKARQKANEDYINGEDGEE